MPALSVTRSDTHGHSVQIALVDALVPVVLNEKVSARPRIVFHCLTAETKQITIPHSGRNREAREKKTSDHEFSISDSPDSRCVSERECLCISARHRPPVARAAFTATFSGLFDLSKSVNYIDGPRLTSRSLLCLRGRLACLNEFNDSSRRSGDHDSHEKSETSLPFKADPWSN